MAETRHPEWRNVNAGTRYPFAERASLSNGARAFEQDTFIDAAIYPVGAEPRMYLSEVEVGVRNITVRVGKPGTPRLAAATFEAANPPDLLRLEDEHGRPAGVLVSSPTRLALLAAWGQRTHSFRPDQTEFAAGATHPTPQPGVRGILLDDGTLLSAEAWIVGGDGVVLTTQGETIRVDVIGDQLFRRRQLSAGGNTFETPRFLQALEVEDPTGTVCGAVPNEHGDIRLSSVTPPGIDAPVLRIRSTPEGLMFEAVGSQIQEGA